MDAGGSIRRVHVLLALLVSAFASAVAHAAGAPFYQLQGHKPGETVTLAVPPQASADLMLLRGADSPSSVTVEWSRFTSDSGMPIVGHLFLNVDGNATPVAHTLALAGVVTHLTLEVPPLPTPEKYTGVLVLVLPGHTEPLSWPIVLTRPAPPQLAIDRGDVWVPVTQWLPLQADDGDFSVQVRDRTGQWPLNGITARIEQVKAPPGFDLGRNLHVWFDGQRVADVGHWPDARPRSVAAGGQATIRGALHPLEPGEYSATLRFAAANSAAGDEQTLHLTVLVRHAIIWPIVVLLLALFLSFLATAYVVRLRRRAEFFGRIRDLRPPWLAAERPTLAVVWVRAALREVEDLSRRWWIASPERIDALLTEAASVVPLLDRARQLRLQFESNIGEEFVRVRATVALGRIVAGLGPHAASDADVTRVTKQLDALGAWLDASEQSGCYWEDLSAAITQLLGEVQLDHIPDPADREVLASMVASLSHPGAPTDVKVMMQLETLFVWLKLLWERHDTPEFPLLLRLRRDGMPLSALFDAADDAAWDRVRAAAEKNALVLDAPIDAGDGHQAYDPLAFEIRSREPGLSETFLFQHGLDYQWTFELTRTHPLEGRKALARLEPKTSTPSVIQFAPAPGKLAVSVVLSRNGVAVPGPSATLEIEPSKDMDAVQVLLKADGLTWAIAAVVALVSGLGLYYVKNPTFGSLQDYLAMFTWGAGVDQGKNLIQTIQTYSSFQKP